jgi:hypothetical protein
MYRANEATDVQHDFCCVGDNRKERDMPTTATAPRPNTVGMREAARFFTDDFLAVALFSALGLLVSLVAAFSGEQGVWL